MNSNDWKQRIQSKSIRNIKATRASMAVPSKEIEDDLNHPQSKKMEEIGNLLTGSQRIMSVRNAGLSRKQSSEEALCQFNSLIGKKSMKKDIMDDMMTQSVNYRNSVIKAQENIKKEILSKAPKKSTLGAID